MKRITGLALATPTLLSCTLFATSSVASPPEASTARPQVMIVGVAHLESKNDVHNTDFDDPLSEKRQKEIGEVVARLSRFRPTKVMVEALYGEPKFAARYTQYRAGTYTLGANEIYQFGFKLAKAAGNPTVFPIDNYGRDLYDSSSADGKEKDQILEAGIKAIDSLDPVFAAMIVEINQRVKSGTMLELLRYLNTPAAIDANAGWYTFALRVGMDHDYLGAAYAANWYERNMRMFANVVKTIDSPQDRVVVLVGQGHAHVLRELSTDMQFVDPLPFLQEPGKR